MGSGKVIAITLLCATTAFWSPMTGVFARRLNAYNESQTPRPIDIVKVYLQASHARDPRSAYHLISAADQRIRDEKTHLKSSEALEGFALALAQKLAAGLEVRMIKQETSATKARLEVAYQVPTGDELSARLFDWNGRKINELPPAAQQRLAGELDDLRRRGKMIVIEGRETFELVREKSGWKIFLDWASRARVLFKSRVPHPAELEVRFVRNDFLVEMNDPFQIDFTLKNRTARPIVVRLNHLIEPRRFADNIEMIACGSLGPMRLDAGETRDLSSSYILGGVPAKSRVSIFYEFVVTPDKQKAISRRSTSRHRPG
jgi:hypothetical protein